MPRGPKERRLPAEDVKEAVGGPIRAEIIRLEERLGELTDPMLRTPLEAQLDEQHRQLAYVEGH